MTTQSRNIFDISSDLQALDDLLSEVGGEITDEQAEEAIDKWFAELGAERDAKLDGYGYLIRSLESDANAVKEEIDRLKARKTAIENKVDRLKSRLEAFLTVNGIDKIATKIFTFAMQKSGGKPKVNLSQFYLDNPVELPEGLRRVKFEADLTAIRERLEAGDETVAQFANIEEPGRHLRIR